MHKQIYVNLAVGSVGKSKAFFSQLGFTFEPRFTNEQAACMVIGENIYAMLLAKDFFQTFTNRTLCNPKESTETLICISCDSRAQVDELAMKALAAGGAAPRPAQDHGFMYARSIEDIDGHIWELMYMDPNADMRAANES
ncbi:glyoxalase/bleomycin resistance/extradiol dioxygenase family protein [Paraburkholderia sp. LEh10]|jgi:predicted lactoylglutathione lyase|uniref:VOC family protein n=1 Tax=Paraburkholderia sp. LEh10 TaxID=2821353 RepID=UPI001AE44259|nr:glyoxalase/bleomycin resistance/extradiol dioxygenase family protein [Paraburkholderia sp. LEh10]MBP0592394.1 glyoxalase/bleomycin resistance/extradiol dioxygenase family protein [Paraburkholderia sp. LEh10]